jgi:hypothetical protein
MLRFSMLQSNESRPAALLGFPRTTSASGPAPCASRILDAPLLLRMRDSILFDRPDPALLLRSRHQHKRQHGREALIRAAWQRFECELEVIIAHLNEVLQMHGSVEDNASRQQRSWQDRPRLALVFRLFVVRRHVPGGSISWYLVNGRTV